MPGIKHTRKEKAAKVNAALKRMTKKPPRTIQYPKQELLPLPDTILLDNIVKNHARQDYHSQNKPNPSSLHSTPIGRDVKADRVLPEFKPAKTKNGGTAHMSKYKPPYQLAECTPDYVESYRSGLREAKADGYQEPEIPELPHITVTKITKTENGRMERKPDYRSNGVAYENLKDWKPGQR